MQGGGGGGAGGAGDVHALRLVLVAAQASGVFQTTLYLRACACACVRACVRAYACVLQKWNVDSSTLHKHYSSTACIGIYKIDEMEPVRGIACVLGQTW